MPRAGAKRSIRIEAAPEDVYDFALGDLSSVADWLTSVEKVEEADPTWPAIGASYTYSREVQQRTVRGKTTVLEADRPRRVVLREELRLDGETGKETPEDKVGRSIWTFEPENGGTLVTMEAVGIDMGNVTYLLWRTLLSSRVERNVEATLESLKRICEEELEDATEENATEATDG
jgi:carbon monoxide dehydrogenase subunit G